MVFKRLMGCSVEDLIRWLPEDLALIMSIQCSI